MPYITLQRSLIVFYFERETLKPEIADRPLADNFHFLFDHAFGKQKLLSYISVQSEYSRLSSYI